MVSKPESKHSASFTKTVQQYKATVVVLSEAWKETLAPIIGDTLAISNPIPPTMVPPSQPRERNHLLLLGRADPVKGHDFAMKVARGLHQQRPSIRLSITGLEHAQDDFIHALGWISEEEKLRLLQTASLLLLPSAYEGQPMVALEASACGLPIVASEHLSSLPDSVSTAGAEIEDWVSVVGKLLDDPRTWHRSMLATNLQRFNASGTIVIVPGWEREGLLQVFQQRSPRKNALPHATVPNLSVLEAFFRIMWKALPSIHGRLHGNPPVEII